MVDFPVKLLVTGYGGAAAAGAAWLLAGGGVWAAVLVLWLGGAVLTLALAATPRTARAFARAADRPSRNVVSQDELRLWDQDLAAEGARHARRA